MSKAYKRIKKGLHEAIAHAEECTPGTCIHYPHERLTLFFQSDQLDENCKGTCKWGVLMSRRKISIEDFKNDRTLNLHIRKSKEVARALDAQSETLPYSKVFSNRSRPK
jgi:hypothetical protein